MTDFIYLLNAMENAAAQENPSKHDYAGKRRAVLDYVRALAKLQQQHEAEREKWLGDFRVQQDAIARLQAERDAAVAKALERAANEIPHTWLDPLLTGPDAITRYSIFAGPGMEQLCKAIKTRILTLKPRSDMVCVPREPATLMLDEAFVLFDLTPARASEIYKAMLAAAEADKEKA